MTGSTRPEPPAGHRVASRTTTRLLLLVCAFGALVACGGVAYTARIISASQAVEQAREAGAAELAPYEYHYAVENLDKAREEAGEAEYQDAVEFAGLAETFGNKALKLARERRMRAREDATRPVVLDRPVGADEGTDSR